MSLQVEATDKYFYDSPDAGHLNCICSRCNKAIPEKDSPIIRMWPTQPCDYGYDPKVADNGGTEFRFCRSCSEKMGITFAEDLEDPYENEGDPY